MANDTTTEMLAAQQRSKEAEAQAQAKSDQLQKDHALALAKGQSPEQVEARKRVVKVFFEWHLPDEKPEAMEAFLQRVDYTQPVVSMNARGVDIQNPKSRGFLGLGRKPAYLLSKQHPPASDQDPIYCLEYYPVSA